MYDLISKFPAGRLLQTFPPFTQAGSTVEICRDYLRLERELTVPS